MYKHDVQNAQNQRILKNICQANPFCRIALLFFFFNSNLIQYDNIPIKAARPVQKDLLSPGISLPCVKLNPSFTVFFFLSLDMELFRNSSLLVSRSVSFHFPEFYSGCIQ